MPLMASDLAGEREVSMTSRDVPHSCLAFKKRSLSHRRPVQHTVKREAKSERRILREGGSIAERPTSRVANACAKAGRVGGGKEKIGGNVAARTT